MHDNLRNHASEEVPDQADGEAEAGPVVPVLHNLEGVAVEVDVTVKILLVEGLHGDPGLAMVLELILGLLEGEVVLDGAAGEPGLLGLAGADG